jgi:iron complex transport system ATP-binding protein
MEGSALSPLVEMDDATLIRGGVRVLDRISLVVRSGEHTAILGPNGAGKTSLIRMLTLEDRPLRRNGVPSLRLFGCHSWDVEALRRRLGVVTADLDAAFGLGTSGGRVIGLDVALSGLFGSQGVFSHHDVTDAMREQAQRALDRVEASHLAARPLNTMSTGERRRVLIARALVTDPDALVLDEPTAGLDVVARHRFMAAVGRLARQGTTVILVTHHVEEIVPETRQVVLLRNGRVAFAGEPALALTGARMTDLFGAPVAVERSGGYFHVRMASNPGEPGG